MNIPHVAVLLSSYNGERYIEEQIHSILAQQDVRVTLYVRDDGSSDSTVEIVARLASMHSNIIFNVERNIGLIGSFFDLLKRADKGFKYYAFADQDDVWIADKLAVGVGCLSPLDGSKSAMYCSRTEYVNESLQHLSYSPAYKQANIGFGNALVQNVATGCTIVINADARKLIVKELPKTCIVHDWWVYLVISAFGLVIYDQVSHIKYRQHGGNVIGASSSFTKNSIKRTRRFFGSLRKNKTSSQIAEFYRIFRLKMTPDQIDSVTQILVADRSMWSRLSLVCKRFYWRQSLVDNLLLRIVMVTGRF